MIGIKIDGGRLSLVVAKGADLMEIERVTPDKKQISNLIQAAMQKRQAKRAEVRR